MAHTNETTNYGLTQFLGTDKPSWLNDYNGDNLKIDTAMKNISDQANTAAATASGLTTEVESNTNKIISMQNDIDIINDNVSLARDEAHTAQITADISREYGLNDGGEVIVKWAAHGFITSNSTDIYLFLDLPKVIGNNISTIELITLNVMIKSVAGNLVGSTYYDLLHDPDITVNASAAGNSQIRIKITKSTGFPAGGNNGPVEAYGTIELRVI